MTVFLTTQYLEEADALSHRVAIIDHGRIVAEGTPAALKAEVGRPTVEATPQNPADRDSTARVLARFGEPVRGSPRGNAGSAGEEGGSRTSQRWCGLWTPRASRSSLQLHAASLNDVFLAKTGRSLEGRGAPQAPDAVSPAVTT